MANVTDHASSASRALGGMTAAARMTPEERTARARKAALAGVAKRAEMQREKKRARREGALASWEAAFDELAARLAARLGE